MNQKLIEKLAVKSLVEYNGELIFSKEIFAELIIRECADIASINAHQYESPGEYVKKHFGIES